MVGEECCRRGALCVLYAPLEQPQEEEAKEEFKEEKKQDDEESEDEEEPQQQQNCMDVALPFEALDVFAM